MPNNEVLNALEKLNKLCVDLENSQYLHLYSRFFQIKKIDPEELNDYGFDSLGKSLTNLLEKYKEISDEFNLQFIIFNENIDASLEDNKKYFQRWKEHFIDSYIIELETTKESYDKTKSKRDMLPAFARNWGPDISHLESLLKENFKNISELKNKVDQQKEFQEGEFENIEEIIREFEYVKELKIKLNTYYFQYIQADRSNHYVNETLIKMLDRAQKALKNLNEIMPKIEDLKNTYNKSTIKEKRDIVKGLYQKQLFEFTYRFMRSHFYNDEKSLFFNRCSIDCNNEGSFSDDHKFVIFPILESSGLRCTAAVPTSDDADPIEIQINFFGTVDSASLTADTEKGGPGQKKLKKYEAKLLEQIENLIKQLSELYPEKKIRLRIAGHSLGGALAKGFTHALQRAIAIQNDTPENITKKIGDELPDLDKGKHEEALIKLQEQLTKDKTTFNQLNGLKNISGITLYTLGSPGVSNNTDKLGTLLTYYHDPNLLRVYNHYHEEDIITKYGEAEFLSGRELEPRISTLYEVKYKSELSESEIEHSAALPFPNVTKRVMAAHTKLIDRYDDDMKTEISRMNKLSFLSEKYEINEIKRKIVRAGLIIANLVAGINFLNIPKYTKHEVNKPVLRIFKEFKDGLNKSKSDQLKNKDVSEKTDDKFDPTS